MASKEKRKYNDEYVKAHWLTSKLEDIAKHLDITTKTVQNIGRKQGLRPKTSEFLKELRQSNTFEQKLDESNFNPVDNWSHGWLKTKEASIFVKNPNGTIDLEQLVETLFKDIIKRETPKRDYPKAKEKTFDRLVITDIHIGLDPNKSGNSMYPMKWGEEDIYETLETIVDNVLKYKTSDVLYIDNLGDYLDGYEGQTTRGGHSLDQNMSTEKQFTVGIDWFVRLIEILVRHYDFIYIRNITNDNHAGNFGLICGVSIKKIVELKFRNVEFVNQKAFIDHYQIGRHIYLLCHGKDRHLMKYAFSAIPNKDNIHKIENYISNQRLDRDCFIEFSKGDSHIYNADNGSSDLFSYISYPTLAPNSEWITTNFKKGKRGFVFENVEYNSNNKSIHPIYI